MPRILKPLAASVAMAALLAGCAIGPDYKTPALITPLKWMGMGGDATKLTEPSAEVINPAWWQSFGDPLLDRLMQQALQRNGDLRVAIAKVDEARGARLGATAGLLPAIDGSAGASRGNAGVSTNNRTVNNGSASLDASWEIDLFGGNRRAAEAARANLGGAHAAERLARIRLLAEVASTYLNVRSLQQQALLTQRNLDDQSETLRLTELQNQEGIASSLDLARARALAADPAAQLPQVQANLSASLNSLGVLVGMQPPEIATLMQDPRPVPVASPRVLVATPAKVLAARPDVAIAERNLAAATANQGVALANWFPKISLTGLFGLQDPPGRSALDVWNVGGTISLPLIDFGRVRALTRQADARQQQALATYEQAVLAALADVETSLTGYAKAVERLQKLQTAAQANRSALEFAKAQYKEGLIAQLDVLVAQQQSAAADIALAQGEAAVGQNLATLYKAIGGGE
jgi:multidrug efflux system outer membrane protein